LPNVIILLRFAAKLIFYE